MTEQNTPQSQPSDSTPGRKLNIAGRVAAYFIDSKLTMLIMVFAFLAGVYAFLVRLMVKLGYFLFFKETKICRKKEFG